MVMLSGAEVAALKLLSAALVAVTMHMPTVVVAATTPVKAFTLQMVGVLLAKLIAPVPSPPLVVSVAVPPKTRLDGLLEIVSAA